jgi:hypothetical protein
MPSRFASVLFVVVGIGVGAGAVGLPAGADPGAPTQSGPVWQIQTTPNPTGSLGSSLSSVSCTEDGSCMAVGTYYTSLDPPPGTQDTLAEQWNATSWAIVTTPSLSGVDNAVLTGVSCVKSNACIAVGYTVTSPDNSVVRALVESWNGRAWTKVATPLPAGATWVTLTDVSCVRASSCVAVGGYIKKNNEVPLAESWNGSVWSILDAPNPHAENGSAFTTIDCVKTNKCEATGDYDYADVAQSLIAYSYDGTSWLAQKQENPSGQESNSDNGLSCTAANACTSVGSWTPIAASALAESWNGTSWTRQKVPAPSSSKTDELNGVSCVAGDTCAAVGDWATNRYNGPSSTLAEEWHNGAWKVTPTPNPSGASSSLSNVSCIGSSDCIAVGSSYNTSSEVETTLAEIYSS